MSSSFVGITRTSIFERGVEITASSARTRAFASAYPPGSTFKPFMALAALQTGKRSASTIINDAGSWSFGGHVFRSHGDHGLGPVDMHQSIVKSSNVYYYSLANEMGVDLIHDQMSPLGFGRKTGIDVEGEITGDLPSTEWKKRYYKKPAAKLSRVEAARIAAVYPAGPPPMMMRS